MRVCFLFCSLVLSTLLRAGTGPKIVVGIVVDQMRYDYLLRYGQRFGPDGFKRLQAKGYSYINAHYNYLPTYTGPGHASIYTGTTPSQHGIIANEWYDRGRGDFIACAEDPGTLGPRMESPANLVSTTITDQLALATNFGARIIGISIKARGAVLPAGHAALGAYWFDSRSGKMESSPWYVNAGAEWVHQFNKKGLALKYLSQDWNTLYPLETYTASAPDDNPYENSLEKGGRPVFPYKLSELQKDWGYRLLPYTPYGNTWVFEAGKAAIEGAGLGADSICDFLCLSISGTDYAGHYFGPQAVEMEDIYLRLDRDLAEFLNYLDAKFGEGNYTVFLSSDHGANEVPALLRAHQMPGGLIDVKYLDRLLRDSISGKYGDSLYLGYSNEQIYLDHARIRALGYEPEAVTRYAATLAATVPGIYRATAAADLHEYLSDPLFRKLWNGYYPGRSGDVLLLTKPGWMEYDALGTSHGSGYSYDTRVPVLFMGYGVRPGQSSREVSICDIAPTLALIMGIQYPSACTGQPLRELLGY